MYLLAVNVSQPKPIQMARRQSMSGIFKDSVAGPVSVGELGLEGDVQVNRKYHGGADQAVYLYARDDYSFWEQELGRQLALGCLGDNLTVDSWEGVELCIGDRIRIRDVVLEVSGPRVPCATLAAALEVPTLVKKFNAAERIGCYCRVLQTGTVEAGMAVSYASLGGIPLVEVFRMLNARQSPAEGVQEALRWPVARRVREAFEARLCS